MSESPSIYLPRQRRPRQPVEAAGPRAHIEVAKPVRQRTVRVVSTDSPVHSVAISGFLGRQIRELAQQIGVDSDEPTLCGYLLGYVESDGSVQLNRLDQGIYVNGHRVPTAAYGTDTVVPLYCGASRARFYSMALKPGHIFRVAAWLVSTNPSGQAELATEFISAVGEARVSVEPATAVEVAALPELLSHVRRDATAKQGPLRRQSDSDTFLPDHSPLLPPERTVWSVDRDDNDDGAIQNAYISAGMPRSLHIARIMSDATCRSALVQHYLVVPLAGTCSVGVRLALVDLATPSNASCSRAMFVSIAQHGHGAPGIIHDVATQHRLEIFDATSVAATPRPPMLQPSPLLDRIVASAQALASPAVRSAGAPQQPIHDGVGGDSISELLKEQRQIRVLLEEQNQLIKTHVSQTQELMHMARHQPSPQTVTRRYLRMRGTHTPTLTSTHRRTSDAGHGTANAVEDSGKLTMRRSNSLSEIVDGIRSFEVEGYEETQHHPSHGMRQPLSFTSPVYMAQSARAESPTATHSTAARSSATGSSINNLVSRINRLVGDSNAAQPAFERPPLPAHGRPQPRNLTLGSKVTPTTQKYLDSLGADDSPLPAPRHLS